MHQHPEATPTSTPILAVVPQWFDLQAEDSVRRGARIQLIILRRVIDDLADVLDIGGEFNPRTKMPVHGCIESVGQVPSAPASVKALRCAPTAGAAPAVGPD
jgi:hypothetical protein